MFKLFIAALLIILTIPKQISFAQNIATDSATTMQFESVNPGSPYYIFKRLKEAVTLNFLTFGEQNKAKYTEQLLDTRFKELIYGVETGKIGYLENIAGRYTNQGGTIIEKYIKIDRNFKSQGERYLPVLARLRDHYPSNSAYWLMLQAAIDTTKRIVGY